MIALGMEAAKRADNATARPRPIFEHAWNWIATLCSQ